MMRLSLAILYLWICTNVDATPKPDCPPELPSEKNADISIDSIKTSYSAGDKIQFTCKAGYVSKLEIGYVCSDHKWTQDHKGECTLVTCPTIKTGGDLTASGNTEGGGIGDVIQFECKSSDKTIDGSSSIICKDTGDWNASAPNCIEISCKPPNIQHGNVRGVKNYKKDDTLEYDCGPGYKPRKGNPKCGKHGWTVEPKCVSESEVVKCPKIHTDGDLTASGNTEDGGYGDVIQFDCKSSDKTIDGSSSIICMDTGDWNASAPNCIEISCKPPNIQHGNVRGVKNYKKDDTLEYDCGPGYKPRKGNPKCGKHGWTVEPKCVSESEVVKCPKIHTDGDLTASGNTEDGGYGDVIQFDCKSSDKTIDGSSSIICMDTGDWNASAPNCIEISCKPPNIQHGNVRGVKNYKKDDTLEYDCGPGYKPRKGNPKCGKHGWTVEPKCVSESEVVKCPKIHTDGDLTASGNTEDGGYGDVIQFDCKSSDKTIDGSSSIICMDTGDWNASAPNCIEISCKPPNIQHGNVRGVKNYKKDDTLEYDCGPGYKPRKGNPKCGKHGWTVEPKCVSESEVVKCPKIHTDGDLTASGNTEDGGYGDVIQFDCKSSDKTIDGSSSIICMDTGDWNASAPNCIEISCKPPNIQHGNVRGVKNYKKDDTLEYDCGPGYKPRKGNPKCGKHGWTVEPKCVSESEVVKCPPIHIGGDLTASGNTEDGGYGDVIQFDCKSSDKTIDGSNSIICKDTGVWNASVPNCIEISCKPPNIQHGTVTHGKDYKKDDTLEYNCGSGYKPGQGTTKCGKHGWTVEPKCEVVKCPKIHTEGDVSASGNTDNGGYGDVIQFDCKSANKRIDGSSSIYCKDTGDWNAPVPNCIEITCRPPNIQHGNVRGVKDYKKDDTLEYDCGPGYKPRKDTPKCTKDGWTVEPKCVSESEVVKCPPINTGGDLTASGNTEGGGYGDVIQFDCKSPNKRIDGSSSIICMDTGDWNASVPNCIEISCKRPPIQHGTVKQVKDYKKDDTLQYECGPGYKPRQGTSKCAKHGWTLEPKCEETTDPCNTPTVENGYIHTDRSKKRMIYYTCNPGYKPDTGTCWKAATCVRGIWRNVPRCIKVDECGPLPKIQHGKLITKQSAVQIQCDPGFEPSNTVIRCVRGAWQTPTCESFCSMPHQEVNNAKLIDKIRGERKYSHGDTARYECYDDHECHGPTIAKCDTQTWIYPECTKKGQCTKPTMDMQFVTLLDDKKTFNNLDVLRYKCNKPYDKKPNGVLICKNGKWDGTFDCTSGICPAPPMIEHGDFKVEQKTGEVVTSVSYTCQPYFELNKQQRYYRCLNGKWETPPSCLKPCKITPEICKEHNIKPVLDHHMRHSDNDFKLHCNDGWNVGGSLGHSHSKAWCKDGELKIESKCTARNKHR
ncbi:complement factor H-like isoform X2 [Paramisgurnus dabryanus]|uniref:complement factor H-like isoform X2 n=1 Tax=Paramisgurnus dabryanus TaxID=90735 RepID=UPI003CCF79F5